MKNYYENNRAIIPFSEIKGVSKITHMVYSSGDADGEPMLWIDTQDEFEDFCTQYKLWLEQEQNAPMDEKRAFYDLTYKLTSIINKWNAIGIPIREMDLKP